MEPNIEQIKGQLRTYIGVFGGVIAGWFAHSGYVTADQVLGVLNSPAFLGVAAAVVSAVWSMIAHKQSNAIAIVAAIAADPASPVKAPILENTVVGRRLADDIKNANPEAVVEVAGTAAAANAAKA